MICPICHSSTPPQLITKDYTGYVKNTHFDLFKCLNCETHFMDMSKLDPKLYNEIYTKQDVAAYDRYFDYAKTVKNQANPLGYLAKQGEMYYPIYKYLEGKQNLDILEVGCGYGYTAYSVHKSGQNVTAIDISNEAIDFATKNFGNFYTQSSIENFKTDKKYDLIYSTEVIEHVADPVEFINKIKNFLKPNGKILLTTPDKNYNDTIKKDVIWDTDLPPVHTFWLTQKGARELARLNDLKISFFDYGTYATANENAFFEYKALKKERVPISRIGEEKEAVPSYPKNNKVKYFIRQLFNKNPLRKLSAIYVHGILGHNYHRTMTFFLSK